MLYALKSSVSRRGVCTIAALFIASPNRCNPHALRHVPFRMYRVDKAFFQIRRRHCKPEKSKCLGRRSSRQVELQRLLLQQRVPWTLRQPCGKAARVLNTFETEFLPSLAPSDFCIQRQIKRHAAVDSCRSVALGLQCHFQRSTKFLVCLFVSDR